MTELQTLQCGCEYDPETGVVYWNGLGPSGCTEHEPEDAFELTVLPPENLPGPLT